MISDTKKTLTNESVFLLIYALWFLALNLTRTYFRALFNLNDVLTFVYGVIYIYFLWYLMTMEESDKAIYVKIMIFVIIGGLSYYFSGVNFLLSLVCMCVCARNVDYKKIFSIFIIIALTVMIFTIVASGVGLINCNVSEGARFRSSLGYTYYSFPSHIILFVTLAYLAIRETLTFIEIGVLFIANFVIYQITDTRVPFYTACLILICCLIVWGIKKFKTVQNIGQHQWLRNVLLISPFLFLAFSYAIHFFYNSDSPFWVKLNQWLNTRLALGHSAILGIPHTLLGQQITWNDWAEPLGYSNYFFVDNSFINIMLNEGVLYMILVLLGFSYVLKRSIDSKNSGLILSIIGCLILGLADPELADPRFQPMILLISWMFCSDKQKDMLTEEGDKYG